MIKYKIRRYPDKINSKTVDKGIRQGLNMWTKSIPYLEFRQITEENEDISFAFTKFFDKFINTRYLPPLACADRLCNTICFNENVFWSLDGSRINKKNESGITVKINTHKIPQVTAHEIGHILGLGHTDDKNDIMYCEDIPDNISSNDIQKMEKLLLCRQS